MQRIIILLSISLFLNNHTLRGQQACECSAVFDEAVKTVENVYAGFHDKVNEKTKVPYDQHKLLYQQNARNIAHPKHCHINLLNFLDFFNDTHIYLHFWQKADPRNKKVLEINEKKLQKMAQKKQHHPLMGIWKSEDNRYKYAIVPDDIVDGGYAMVVIEEPEDKYAKGTVIMEFINIPNGKSQWGYFYKEDFSYTFHAISLDDNILDLGTHKVIRQASNSASAIDMEDIPAEVGLKRLNGTTNYLRVPTFKMSVINYLDSLLINRLPDIKSLPNLIIDIRDNGGGNASIPESLLKIIYSDTLYNPYWDYRISEAYFKVLEKQNEKGYIDSTFFQNSKKAIGTYWRSPASAMTFDSVYSFPKNIAVVMNEGCASSAEYFIYYAKQSDKVTLFGKPSNGTMDYGLTNQFDLSCGQFVFIIPVGRNGWVDSNPIDKVGFQPDIVISESENWIDFIIKTLENK